MTKDTVISGKGLALIKVFEGFRANATLLPNGIWVIGHGHTSSAREGGLVDLYDAEDLLLWDMSNLNTKIKDCIFAPLSQPQLDGLLSLAFNIGIENFANSDVVRFLNEGNVISAASAFDVWRKAKLGDREMVVDALVRRRTAEKAHFLDVAAGKVLAPSARLIAQRDEDVATRINKEDVQQKQSPTAVEVSIDLANSAALSSLLSASSVSDDGIDLSFNPDADLLNKDQPSVALLDDDNDSANDAISLEPVPVADETSLVAETKIVDEANIVVPLAQDGAALVPIGDIFAKGTASGPVGAVAENIAGRMAKIATNVEDEPITNDESDNTSDNTDEPLAANDTEVSVTERTGDEAALPPPISSIVEVSTPVEPSSLSDEAITTVKLGDFPYDEHDQLPPLPSEGELSPLDMSKEGFELNDRNFVVLEQRNIGMYVLMGILGLICTVGGIFETRKLGGVIVDQWDWITGPGLTGLGILLILVAVYFLIRRMVN
ncbi:MAG: lysozyme [Robiginitomaculum sp.]|nr:lysozyme [Robiginitomaculum sp.]